MATIFLGHIAISVNSTVQNVLVRPPVLNAPKEDMGISVILPAVPYVLDAAVRPTVLRASQGDMGLRVSPIARLVVTIFYVTKPRENVQTVVGRDFTP